MAKAILKITKTTKVTRTRVKKSSSKSSEKKKGNPNHCPVCGKFI